MNCRIFYLGRKMWASLAMALCLGVLGYFTFRAEAANPQEQERVSAGQAQQPTENLPELQARQQFDPNAGPNKECIATAKFVDYVGGNSTDNFGGGPDPVVLSPELAQYLTGKPARKFDEEGPNKILGNSFRIGNCKVCAAQVIAKLKTTTPLDVYTNDTMALYGKNIQASDQIWSVPTASVGVQSFSAYLPAASIAKLNQHIFTNAPGHWLNFLAGDDHPFDFVKVRIWYY